MSLLEESRLKITVEIAIFSRSDSAGGGSGNSEIGSLGMSGAGLTVSSPVCFSTETKSSRSL